MRRTVPSREHDAHVVPERECPICRRKEARVVFDQRIDTFDGTTLDSRVFVVSCDNCGAVYNDGGTDTESLEEYYQRETLYSGESGFGIGGTSAADINRYSRYLEYLSSIRASKNLIIADIGCAKGGFLAYLKKSGYSNLRGVEIDPKCIEYARRNFGLVVEQGSVDALPFGNGEVDILVYSHVFEHLYDPLQALHESKRVLKDDGIIFMEVPNASCYSDGRVFDFFWFCIREHINHFDLPHLTMLMESAGFEVTADYQQLMLLSSNYYYPSLCALFRKSCLGPKESRKSSRLAETIREYVSAESEAVRLHDDIVAKLVLSGRQIYVWGVGLEFFSLQSFTRLRDSGRHRLVDRNISKQAKTVSGIAIEPPECLIDAPSDAVVLITSVFHVGEMVDYLEKVRFSGQIVTLEPSVPAIKKGESDSLSAREWS